TRSVGPRIMFTSLATLPSPPIRTGRSSRRAGPSPESYKPVRVHSENVSLKRRNEPTRLADSNAASAASLWSGSGFREEVDLRSAAREVLSLLRRSQGPRQSWLLFHPAASITFFSSRRPILYGWNNRLYPRWSRLDSLFSIHRGRPNHHRRHAVGSVSRA